MAAAVLGHADIRTTLQVYTHSAESLARDAVEKVARALQVREVPHDATQSGKPLAGPFVV